MVSTRSRIETRVAQKHDLPAAAALLSDALGFSEADAIPAWLIHTTTNCGGLALAALDGERLIGFSYAFPAAADGEPFLFSCGLAVDPEHRGRGVAAALKQLQRTQALELGYGTIRWTADPLAAGPLHLYLSRLGAALTGYHSGMYSGIRESSPPEQDDVEIEWQLTGDAGRKRSAAPGGPIPGRQSESIGDGLRRLVDRHPIRMAGAWYVELPWDARRLMASHPEAALEWRIAVREIMLELIADGAVGVAVEVDRPAERAFVRLERARTHAAPVIGPS